MPDPGQGGKEMETRQFVLIAWEFLELEGAFMFERRSPPGFGAAGASWKLDAKLWVCMCVHMCLMCNHMCDVCTHNMHANCMYSCDTSVQVCAMCTMRACVWPVCAMSTCVSVMGNPGERSMVFFNSNENLGPQGG